MKEDALILTNGLLDQTYAKTCHGLIRNSSRFNLLGIIDQVHVGKDAGEVIDGIHRGIDVYSSVVDYFEKKDKKPKYLVVGVAFPGGQLPENCRGEIKNAIEQGISVVSGLHQFINDDIEFKALASKHGVELIDIRKSRPTEELHYWTGEIFEVTTPRIAVLGMDCIIGKRTTCGFLIEGCEKEGIKAEMIYTGQTGWLQGHKHGFILDSTVNDFVSGEIERSIVECHREESPDVIFIEGQASLQNPSGPCGSEFIISGNVKGIILQHAPGRECYKHKEELGYRIPSVESEINLIKAYGSEVLAITLSELDSTDEEMVKYKKDIAERLGIPVVRPLVEGTDELMTIVKEFMQREEVNPLAKRPA